MSSVIFNVAVASDAYPTHTQILLHLATSYLCRSIYSNPKKQQRIQCEKYAAPDKRSDLKSPPPHSNATKLEAGLVDEAKLSCLLCKRKFDSVDILRKHVAKSDLHKVTLCSLTLMPYYSLDDQMLA